MVQCGGHRQYVAYVIKKSMCGLFILSIKINGAHSRGDFLDMYIENT